MDRSFVGSIPSDEYVNPKVQEIQTTILPDIDDEESQDFDMKKIEGDDPAD